MNLIHMITFIPTSTMRLRYKGKDLIRHKDLSYYNVCNMDTMTLLLRLPGGLSRD